MAIVRLNSLNKTYPNGVQAVCDVNLEVADGELVVLVGPSGCGKSTTLRMIAGLEDATSGDIYIGDRRVNDVAPGDRDIAMVFQHYALYPHMTVYQNMAFGLKMRHTRRDEIERRVRHAAGILSIEALLDRRPRELSGGQRQRVALGRAIVREPKVFLFDEPLSNLDAKLRVQTRAEIARLHQRLKCTIVYVTHDQVVAMTLGNRIVLMDRGVVQQVDIPMNIYRRPANRFVASFIGSPAMNFLPGTIEGGEFRSNHSDNCQCVTLALNGDVPNGPATLGVRPEDLVCGDDGVPLAAVSLDVVEHLGHETLVHFVLAGEELVARLPAAADAAPGQQLPLAVRHGAYHLFAADGSRI